MEHSPPATRAGSLLAALAVAGLIVPILMAGGVGAASPDPAGSTSVTMSVEPMLGGSFRSGTWAAVRVHVANDGPVVNGELRISTAAQGASTYGVAIQLPSGARQEHVLYGKTGPFGSRFLVTLVSGGSTVATTSVPIDANEAGSVGVYVIAERPEGLATSIRGAVSAPDRPPPVVHAISVQDLPPRVEAWASVDRLVWQDVNSTSLDHDQLDALRTWVSSGGHLVILGGSTGTTSLAGFPADLLPYSPARVVDVPNTDLQLFLETLPAEATALPALAGTLERGAVLARSGEDVIAARMPYGQGSVALIGIDPSVPWLAGSSAAGALWAQALPPASRVGLLPDPGDDFIQSALSSLPSVQLPRMDQLFLLMVAYVIAIGPLNYFLLRRRDRREWAWLTMPMVILSFALAAYGFGVLTKGSSVIVNELAIVRGAAGTDRGVAEVHAGVFSPSRATFDVKVGGEVLLSAPVAQFLGDQAERPLDVLFGDPATLRGYSVGFGVLRGFRADGSVPAPRFEADLRLVGGALEGSITNASDAPLAHVSLVYGNGLQVFGPLGAGEARSVALDALRPGFEFERLADRLFVESPGADAEAARTAVARRAIVQHLAGGWEERPAGGLGGELFGYGPVILAWRSGGTLAIDVGTPAERVGETLFVLPARATATGPVVFAGPLMRHTVVENDAVESFDEGFAMSMGRGTVTVEFRPVGFEGVLDVTGMSIRLDEDIPGTPAADGPALDVLPADEQPDPEDPLASDPHPAGGAFGLPTIQLFDRVAGTWIEFERAAPSRTYRITEPGRYVDSSGSFRVRFVLRDRDAFAYFSLATWLEGDVQ